MWPVAGNNDTSIQRAGVGKTVSSESQLYVLRCLTRVSSGSMLFAAGMALLANYKTLLFLPNDDDGHQ